MTTTITFFVDHEAFVTHRWTSVPRVGDFVEFNSGSKVQVTSVTWTTRSLPDAAADVHCTRLPNPKRKK